MTAGPRGPTAGLTVEMLAALLREHPIFRPVRDDATAPLAQQQSTRDRNTWAAAAADNLAAWLAPRLPVSPGTPAAARIAPTDAMIAAAWRVVSRWEVRSADNQHGGYLSVCDECDGEGEDEAPETIAHTPTCVIGALRAALAASPETP